MNDCRRVIFKGAVLRRKEESFAITILGWRLFIFCSMHTNVKSIVEDIKYTLDINFDLGKYVLCLS